MYSLDGMSRSLLDLGLEKAPKVPCDSHANCSARLLTLDTYCCQSTNHCCNWFQFAATYKSAETVVPLKAPSILTILAIALLIICFLFVSYCFSILFCFCFKCGIFKRPKVILMRNMAHSESGLFTGGHNSPKHSTSTTSSSSSSSSHCSPNRRHYRQISSNKHQRSGHKKTNNKSRAHRSTRSPTARANRPHYDAEIYVDFDNNQNTESPFLIPPELNDQVQERLQRSANHNTQVSSSDTNQNTVTTTTVSPSAPLADLDMQEVNEAATATTRNLREPILVSSLSTSTTSSLGFGASLAEAIAASELESQQAQTSAEVTSPVDAILNVNNFHYPDEQPPSYDEIIKNRKYWAGWVNELIRLVHLIQTYWLKAIFIDIKSLVLVTDRCIVEI